MANILIGVTGSIAAYKILELTHSLKKANHQVKIILTKDAQNFVTQTSFIAFGAEVYTDQMSNDPSVIMQHINLARWPDLIIVAPLSANTLSKIAMGLADNLLTSTILAATKPIYLVPAMNMYMWQNQIIQDNITRLIQYNFTFWGPDKGLQACGDNGDGRMLEAHEILANITHTLLTETKLFIDKKVTITAGATIEYIDPVRYLSNSSSGKMGYALARAFISHGAKVRLITGPTNLPIPSGLNEVIQVTTADEMLNASQANINDTDIFIGCAAVSDYKIKNYSSQKIKKGQQDQLTLELTQNPDIIATLKQQYPNLFVVGFAAETQNIIEYAKQKIAKKHLDLIIANDVSNNKVFGQDNNSITVINKNLSIIETIEGTKDELAHKIVEIIHQSQP